VKAPLSHAGRQASVHQDLVELKCLLLAAEKAGYGRAIYYPDLLSIGLKSAETCKMSPPLPTFEMVHISLILMVLLRNSLKTANLEKGRPEKLTFCH
jgi:hypothetical protein